MEEIWNEAFNELNESNDKNLKTWLSFAKYVKTEGDEITISFPNSMCLDFFKSNCYDAMLSTLEKIKMGDVKLKMAIDEGDVQIQQPPKEEKEPKKPAKRKENSMLNPRYTFENFIPSETNKFAYKVAMAVAMDPGIHYNPFLIYGGVGLGKTHLLQSIGNLIESENPRKNVIYVTAETFLNDFTYSLQVKKQAEFRIKYRKADILLVDDIHFIDDKIQTQEELFHTFNDLYESNKQIVFTCDRPISELKNFTSRLKNRFTRGVSINLVAPDYETRVAILQKKCSEQNVVIPAEVIRYMAENIKTNVRDLEGSLTTLIAYTNLVDSEITLDVAKDQLKQIISSPISAEQEINISQIVKEVASFLKVDSSDIKGKSRNKVVKDARNICIYLARQLTQFSTTEIGDYFERNHSTVTHSIKTIEEEKRNNAELEENLSKLTEIIRIKAK